MPGASKKENRIPAEDKHLAGRIKNGEEAAFREFSDRFTPRLYSYLCGRGLSKADSGQLVVTTVTQAAMRIKSFRSNNLWGWLSMIARNLSIGFWRKQERLESVEPETLDYLAAADLEVVELEDEESTPVTPSQEAVREGLEELSDNDKTIISLCFGPPEQSSVEVGEILRIKPGAVRTRLCRALKRLETILRKDSRVSSRWARTATNP